MKLVERLWRVGPVPALCALLLLFTPLLGCLVDESEAHAPHPVHTFVDASGMLVDEPFHGDADNCLQFCAPDMPDSLHSVASHVVGTPPPPPAPLLVAILVLLLVAAARAPTGRRRGPPLLPVVSGRMLLTHLCIARR
ncbi:hypothetical protein H0264_27315 [Nocardia huaxiensis]|uniref:Uncharacterized protein n=1 Tax=Nocardia huaxiensis TaxID=2755382 RepID=A0A7D6ZJ58_9NOCA|nr:hypothetical protein [Nocardia huaxiensis]QLY29003.1 hypothetical protein H0264_27315 [Nocardia huaxiensis]